MLSMTNDAQQRNPGGAAVLRGAVVMALALGQAALAVAQVSLPPPTDLETRQMPAPVALETVEVQPLKAAPRSVEGKGYQGKAVPESATRRSIGAEPMSKRGAAAAATGIGADRMRCPPGLSLDARGDCR